MFRNILSISHLISVIFCNLMISNCMNEFVNEPEKQLQNIEPVGQNKLVNLQLSSLNSMLLSSLVQGIIMAASQHTVVMK